MYAHVSQCVTVIKICPWAFIYLLPWIYTVFESWNKLTNLSFTSGFLAPQSRCSRIGIGANVKTRIGFLSRQSHLSWFHALYDISFTHSLSAHRTFVKQQDLFHENRSRKRRSFSILCCVSFFGSFKTNSYRQEKKNQLKIICTNSHWRNRKCIECPLCAF